MRPKGRGLCDGSNVGRERRVCNETRSNPRSTCSVVLCNESCSRRPQEHKVFFSHEGHVLCNIHGTLSDTNTLAGLEVAMLDE